MNSVELYVRDARFNVLGTEAFDPSVFRPTIGGFVCKTALSVQIQSDGLAEFIHIVSPWGEFVGPLNAAVNIGDDIVVQVNDRIQLVPFTDALRRKMQVGEDAPTSPGPVQHDEKHTARWFDEG